MKKKWNTKNNAKPCLNKFGPKTKVIITEKVHKRKIDPGQPLETFRCAGCVTSFKNEQGLSKYEAACLALQLMKKEDNNNKMKTVHQETML